MRLKGILAGSGITSLLAAGMLVFGAGGSSAHDLSLHDICSTGSQPACLDVTDTLDPTSPGGNVRYTATGSNHGGSVHNGVRHVVTLPAGAGFLAQAPPRSAAGDLCAVSGQTATCEVGTLRPGEEHTIISDVVAPNSPGSMCVRHEFVFSEGTSDTNPNPGKQDTVVWSECTTLEGNPDLAQTFAPAGVETTCSTGNSASRANPQVATVTIPGPGRAFDTTCRSTEVAGVPPAAAALGCRNEGTFDTLVPQTFSGTPLRIELTRNKPWTTNSVCYSEDLITFVLVGFCTSPNPTNLTEPCVLRTKSKYTRIVFTPFNRYWR